MHPTGTQRKTGSPAARLTKRRALAGARLKGDFALPRGGVFNKCERFFSDSHLAAQAGEPMAVNAKGALFIQGVFFAF